MKIYNYINRQFEHKTLASVFIGIAMIVLAVAIGTPIANWLFTYFNIPRKWKQHYSYFFGGLPNTGMLSHSKSNRKSCELTELLFIHT